MSKGLRDWGVGVLSKNNWHDIKGQELPKNIGLYGGLNEGGDLMSLAPKYDMFLESLCQELSLSTKIGLTWLHLAKLG